MSSEFQLYKTEVSLEKMINPTTNETMEIEIFKVYFTNEDGDITAAAAYRLDEAGNKCLVQHIGYANKPETD